MIWNEDAILEIIANAVEYRSLEYDAEQVVRGIDLATESELREPIRQALLANQVVAIQEERYPDAQCIERLNHGVRCDLLLLPSGTPSEVNNDLDLWRTGYWLEIKRVAQFLESGPNWWYESTLLEKIPKDIYKLASDSRIFYAGLLLVLFAATPESGYHDLKVWKQCAIEKGCPVGVPRIHDFRINNCLGNGHAFITLFPLRRL